VDDSFQTTSTYVAHGGGIRSTCLNKEDDEEEKNRDGPKKKKRIDLSS
jgi:hypothetical protein